MNSWSENDLKVIDLDYKIRCLTIEFNEKFGENIDNYYKKLEIFIKNRLKNKVDYILREQVIMTVSNINSKTERFI